MSSTDTLAIPAADTPEGALWREILAHDDTTAAVTPAGDDGMLMGGSALSPPDLVARVDEIDTDEGVEHPTNTRVGLIALYSLIRTTPKGRAVCVDELKEKIGKYRYLAADDQELSRWVLFNLMVYVLALWASTGNDKVRDDLGRLSATLAGIRADINTA